MTLYLPGGRCIQASDLVELDSGASGIVFGLADDDAVCVKLYLSPSPLLDRRFAGLRRLAPAAWATTPRTARLAWPEWDLRDEDGLLRGFVMPRIDGSSLHHLLNPEDRGDAVDEPTWATNVQVATDLAGLFARLHAAGVVVGDVSPANVLLDRRAQIALIDCDSVQFTDPLTGERFPSLHLTPEYASPESLQGPTAWLTDEHDRFGLAILICQLLMEGEHPFDGLPAEGPDEGIEGNIIAGASRPFGPQRLVPVAGQLEPDLLPAEISELARRSLVDGHAHPDRRATAVEWGDALRRADVALMGCRHNPRHFYWADLPDCVWCERARRRLGEHYPADPSVARPAAPTGGHPPGRRPARTPARRRTDPAPRPQP
jgi:DNA-binding helix-hairpin-helix protein with protein kinase domain